MKKYFIIITLFLCALSGTTAKAISYRGFVEGNMGPYLESYKEYSNGPLEHYWEVYGGLGTTHGLQISKTIFLGLGVSGDFYHGLEQYVKKDDLNIFKGSVLMVYGDFRWDGFGLFGLGSRISPFVDLKTGYQSQMNFYIGWHYDEKIHWANGFFIRPAIGVRFGLTNHLGINVGLYFGPNLITFKTSKQAKETYTVWDYPYGLSFGLDF